MDSSRATKLLKSKIHQNKNRKSVIFANVVVKRFNWMFILNEFNIDSANYHSSHFLKVF